MKTEGVAKLFKENVEKWGQISLAFIYGSFASKKASPDSDIDIFMMGTVNEDVLIRDLSSLERKLSREINYIIVSKGEYHEKIDNDDPFVKEILREQKIMIIGEMDVKSAGRGRLH
ncbi:MAG TPA: hypothetical protein HA271_00990 [Methanobacterium subterraneum]|uniref:protein adenylyltransferase n=1 Tax=Methanobacterium subterraneum TaxID=59277 RepID=A0A7J4TG78_9EURY|nr:hypothetical protein [Methanobacterium subterraneum]